MILNQKMIKGKIGKTVTYSISDIREEAGYLRWDEWRFYSPAGTLTDDKDKKYFLIPPVSIDLSRDDTFDVDLSVVVQNGETTALYNYSGEIRESWNLGIDGDIVVTGTIPADVNQEINLTYFEVLSNDA